jgi:hypothetical protein
LLGWVYVKENRIWSKNITRSRKNGCWNLKNTIR